MVLPIVKRWRRFSLNSDVECVDFKVSGKLKTVITVYFFANVFCSTLDYTILNSCAIMREKTCASVTSLRCIGNLTKRWS